MSKDIYHGANLDMTDTFAGMVVRVNDLIHDSATIQVTTTIAPIPNTVNGGTTVGNAHIQGTLSGNTLATPSLMGGTIEHPANLMIGSNTTVQGWSVFNNNATVNGNTYLNGSNVTVNANTRILGTNTVITSNTTIQAANVTLQASNTFINSTDFILNSTRSVIDGTESVSVHSPAVFVTGDDNIDITSATGVVSVHGNSVNVSGNNLLTSGDNWIANHTQINVNSSNTILNSTGAISLNAPEIIGQGNSVGFLAGNITATDYAYLFLSTGQYGQVSFSSDKQIYGAAPRVVTDSANAIIRGGTLAVNSHSTFTGTINANSTTTLSGNVLANAPKTHISSPNTTISGNLVVTNGTTNVSSAGNIDIASGNIISLVSTGPGVSITSAGAFAVTSDHNTFTGNVFVGQQLSVSSSAVINGPFFAKGGVTLGDAAADGVNVLGTVNGPLLNITGNRMAVSSNTFISGNVTANGNYMNVNVLTLDLDARNTHLNSNSVNITSNNISITGSANVTGNVTVTGHVEAQTGFSAPGITANNDVVIGKTGYMTAFHTPIASNLLPGANTYYSLGTTNSRWNSAWIKSVSANTLTATDVIATNLSGKLNWSNVTNRPSPVLNMNLIGDVEGAANASFNQLGSTTLTMSVNVIQKTVVLGSGTSGNFVSTITGADGVAVTNNANTEAAEIIVRHADTSAVANVSTSPLQVVNGIAMQFDKFGHVVGHTINTIDPFPLFANTAFNRIVAGGKTLTAGGIDGIFRVVGGDGVSISSNLTTNEIQINATSGIDAVLARGDSTTRAMTVGSISGNGAGLTSIPAGQLTGTINNARIPANIVRNTRNINTGTGLVGGGNLGGDLTIAPGGMLAALQNQSGSGNGILVKVSGDNVAMRNIEGADGITVTNGTGFGANPSIKVDSSVIRTTGNQSISGNKTFTSDLFLTGVGANTQLNIKRTDQAVNIGMSFIANDDAAIAIGQGESGSFNIGRTGALQYTQSGVFSVNTDTGDFKWKGVATGNGYGITNLDSTALVGTINNARIPSNIVRNTIAINAGSGLTGGGSLTANRSLHVNGGIGILANNTGVHVLAGDGISANSTSVNVDSSVVRTSRYVIAGDGMSGGGNLVANRTLSVLPGIGLAANATGVHVLAGDGMTANSTSVNVDNTVVRTTRNLTAGDGLTGGGNLGANRSFAVQAGNGLVANASGVHIVAGSGLSANSTTVNVDNTVVRTSGDQTIAGTLTTGNTILTGAGSITQDYIAPGLNGRRAISFYNDVANSFDIRKFTLDNASWAGVSISDTSFSSTVPFSGSGSGLTNLPAGQLTGTIADARIPGNIVREGVAINSGNGLTGGGSLATSRTLSIQAGLGLLANTSGLHIRTGNGITANNTHLYVVGGDGIDTTGTGVAVDSSVVRTSRVLTAGDGLSGGGNLGANRAFAVDSSVARRTGSQTFSGGDQRFDSNVIVDVNGPAMYFDSNGATTRSAIAFRTTNGGTVNRGIIYISDNNQMNMTGTWNYNSQEIVNAARRYDAGPGLVGGGNMQVNRTISMGTPSPITDTSTNDATGGTHSHSLAGISVRRLIAADPFDGVGQSVFAQEFGIGTATAHGQNRSGSFLSPGAESDGARYSTGEPLPGTWRCMGACPANDDWLTTWQRVA